MLYACKGAHTLFTGQREREREREREKEGERMRCIICPEWLFSFLKGMTGAFAPFSYLVCNNYSSVAGVWPLKMKFLLLKA